MCLSEIGESDLSELSSAPNSPLQKSLYKKKSLERAISPVPRPFLWERAPRGRTSPPVPLLCQWKQQDASGSTAGSAGRTRFSPAGFGLDAVTPKALGVFRAG